MVNKAVYTTASVAFGWAESLLEVRSLFGLISQSVIDGSMDRQMDKRTDQQSDLQSRVYVTKKFRFFD